jgi:hydrogenase maturation protein HypF
MKTVKITITGIVQGVGFRPFIANLANRIGIAGWVRNSSGTVIVLAYASEDAIDIFLGCIQSETPKGALITNILLTEQQPKEFKDFKIIESKPNSTDDIFIPPDMAVCDECVHELFDKSNSRYKYPFISCVSCGARYTIIKEIPFDRERTTMDIYDICLFCKKEYKSDFRRGYAQTISCHDCGPQLILNCYDGIELHGETALQKSIDILHQGAILAVKSIGGYNYICKTDSAETVKNLRFLKARENKPFAIMFADMREVKKYCIVSDEEEKLLTSSARPIVLLERENRLIDENICKESRFIGAFLPYTPLHHLLLNEFKSLIVTSANISDWPIITKDSVMLKTTSPYLSGVLYSTREIVTPLDDSVSRVVLSSTQLIRRSRGYVPLSIKINPKNQNDILAVGGDLKSSFCLLKDNNAYMSQYFGDMQSAEISDAFVSAYEHMGRLFHIHPQVVVTDKHPNYHSKAFGESLGMKTIELQHHAAHIYSVMAENTLNKTIGVAFDGTGFGDDGAMWGGEFFVMDGCNNERVGHLDYTKLCGGDSVAKDAALLAYCYLHKMGLHDQIVDDRFAVIHTALENDINTQLSSSMGRLFDVISALLGLKNYNSYEGECAMAVENCAFDAIKSRQRPYPLHFNVIKQDHFVKINFDYLLREIIQSKSEHVSNNRLALGFHEAVSCMIVEVCNWIRKEKKINAVALSGGVFLNKILLERTVQLLKESDFQVYFNQAVPPNDSGLALGQAFYAAKVLGDD